MSAERPSEQEIARLREAFAADCDEPAPGSVPSSGEAPCPAPERIWDALDGALGPEELREVVDHVAVCPACAEEWRLAAAFRDELSDEAAGAEESDPSEPADLAAARGRRLQVRSWLAAAAVAVLALGVGGVWWSTSRPGAPGTTKAPVYRQGTEQTIESLLQEDRPLPRDQAVLRWTPGPDGSTYDVLVSTEDLTAVADATGLTEARYRIPADALEDLPAGTELLWQVEAVTSDGRQLASPTFVARLE